MNRIIISIFLAAFLLWSAPPASAQETSLTVEECIRVALRENKDILLGRQTLAEMRGKVMVDHSDRLPHVSVEGNYSNWEDVSEDADGENEEVGMELKVRQEVLRFGATRRSTFEVRRALRKETFAHRKTVLDVFYEVRGAFFSYLLTQDEIAQRRELLKEFERKHERMKERYDAGKVILVEVEEAELDVLDERLRISNLKRKLRTQKMDLLSKMGILERTPPRKVRLVGRIEDIEDLDVSSEDSLERMVAEAFRRRIELAELEADVKEQRREVREVAWHWFPDLSAKASYQYRETDVGLDLIKGNEKMWTTDLSATHPLVHKNPPAPEDDGDWKVELGLKFPIFEGLSSWGALKQERAKLRRLTYDLAKKRNEIELEVASAFYNVRGSKEQLEIKRRSAEIKKTRLEVIEAKIELPIESYLTYDDILRQRQTFVAAQKAYFDERFNHVMAGEALRKAMGSLEIQKTE
jgi:outer membrane protein TolC